MDAADVVLLLEKKSKGAGPVTLTPLYIREGDDDAQIHLELVRCGDSLVIEPGHAPSGAEPADDVLAALSDEPQSAEEIGAQLDIGSRAVRKALAPYIKARKAHLVPGTGVGKSNPALYRLGPKPKKRK